MKRSPLLLLLVATGLSACTCGRPEYDPCAWTQWGHDATHGGNACVEGQPLARKLAQIIYDPFTEQEVAAGGFGILAHYQVPLIADDDVYMMVKGGQFISCDPDANGDTPEPCGLAAWGSQTWSEVHYAWNGDVLEEQWRHDSDWKPLPSSLAGWEPLFQPAISGDWLYVPAASGGIDKLDRKTGAVLNKLKPFGDDALTYVAGPISIDRDGNVFYNALRIDDVALPFNGATGWLVKISAGDWITKVDYEALVPDAPAPDAFCYGSFNRQVPRPLPPANVDGQKVLPPAGYCGVQRPGLNVAPAIGPDGTVYTVSRAHGNPFYGYLVAVRQDLSVKWSRSLRDFLHDGCGVMFPSDAPPNYRGTDRCRVGAEQGVDPFTNQQPAGSVSDSGTSSPMVLPDGSILYGAYTSYNGGRGHTLRFSAAGEPKGFFDFGWDHTPSFWEHDGTFSVFMKDNQYSYIPGEGTWPYRLSRLDANLNVEWSYSNTNTQACHVGTTGALECDAPSEEHEDGFEWCVNASAVDPAGNVFALNEDGNVYAITKDGTVRDRLFLRRAIGAAYTPISVDGKGRIYAMNDGELTAIGR